MSMKLYITVPSPFARKCRIVAREKGLIGRIEEIAAEVAAAEPERTPPPEGDDDGPKVVSLDQFRKK